MRAVAIFYGLPRSLRWTSDSIARNAIGPIAALGADIGKVGHFNAPATIDNPRSGELGISYRQPEYGCLALDRLIVEEQADAPIAATLDAFRHHDLGAEAGINSHRNLLHALASLKKAWALAQDHPADIYLLLRPDLEYIDPWPAAEIVPRLLSGEIEFACPSWGDWGGINDRYAIATPRAAAAYVSRFDRIPEIVALGEPRNSEQILAWALEQSGIRIGHFQSRALRVRSDGRTQGEGFDLGLPRRIGNRLRWEIGKRII
ncbi:MAG: hypothetical protein ACRC1J_09455 [Sandaracinobacteroides sp.]